MNITTRQAGFIGSCWAVIGLGFGGLTKLTHTEIYYGMIVIGSIGLILIATEILTIQDNASSKEENK